MAKKDLDRAVGRLESKLDTLIWGLGIQAAVLLALFTWLGTQTVSNTQRLVKVESTLANLELTVTEVKSTVANLVSTVAQVKSTVAEVESKLVQLTCENAGTGDQETFGTCSIAAESGSSSAMVVLGRMYATGQGVDPDTAKASEWFRRAAEMGNADAKYSLGLLNEMGHGVEQNWSRAATWFKDAAEDGHPQAQLRLASMYESGVGVERDEAKAQEWLARSHLSRDLMPGAGFVDRGSSLHP